MRTPLKPYGILSYAFVALWLLLTIAEARASSLTARDFAPLIRAALAGEGASSSAHLEFDAPGAPAPDGALADAVLEAWRYAPTTGRFTARFQTDGARAPFAVSGVAVSDEPSTDEAPAPAARRRSNSRSGARAAAVVAKGDMVTVLVEAPGIRLSSRGLAQSRGAVGDVIDVLALKSERVVKAVVIDRGLAHAAGYAQ